MPRRPKASKCGSARLVHNQISKALRDLLLRRQDDSQLVALSPMWPGAMMDIALASSSIAITPIVTSQLAWRFRSFGCATSLKTVWCHVAMLAFPFMILRETLPDAEPPQCSWLQRVP